MWSSEPGRVARRTVGGPARFPVMALREDRSGGPTECAREFPHDCAVVMATRSGAERNDPPRAPFSAFGWVGGRKESDQDRAGVGAP